MKTLIAFCTRYGATETTANEIAKTLVDEGFPTVVTLTALVIVRWPQDEWIFDTK